MNILVIGSGGREHALVWKIKQSPKVKKIYCAPGNGGIGRLAECVDIKADNLAGLLKFAKEKRIDLTVVGPEVPLVLGIVDEFVKRNLVIFGPSKKAAQLEGSKIFAKEFMQRHKIPTAENLGDFNTPDEARRFVQTKELSYPVVLKADGLAAGKGVTICATAADVLAAIDTTVKDRSIVEEYLEGEEASLLAISDGKNFVMLDSSQDHKRIFDGDQGPNTGGMGAYSPAPVITADLMKKIAATIIKPVIDGMGKEGNIFKGVLYAGLMITKKGPRVLEFNVRLGDPETQALLPRLKTDIVDVMSASCQGTLGALKLAWEKKACVCVVMAAEGYPGAYEKGKEIAGLNLAEENSEIIVFHAGTKKENDKIVTSGGRVLNVSGLGDNVEQAIKKVYNGLAKIKFDGCFYRKDIGHKALTAGVK